MYATSKKNPKELLSFEALNSIFIFIFEAFEF